MKKLQNNFTTPEQSKRLLALGVPADSADCYYHHYFANDPTPRLSVLQLQWDETIGAIRGKSGQKIDPCWSVGRLIEICLKCSTLEQRQVRFFYNGDDDEYYIVDYIVTVLESGIMTNHMDFSKLEE